jgi:glycosyltransferase involved in cell wall biosynthesis
LPTSPDAPLVTIGVLTLDRLPLLKETLDSILAQTMGSFEVILIDNGSTDGTREFCEGLAAGDERFRFFGDAKPGNLAINRNYTVKHAGGRFIAYCDDDDLWEPDKLEVQLAEFEANPGLGMVTTDALAFGEEGPYGRLVKRKGDGWLTVDDLLSGYDEAVVSSVLIDKTVFDDVGLFDEDPAIFTQEDYEMWVRIAKARPIRYLDRPLVRYRIHGGMVSHKDARELIAKEKVLFAGLHRKGVLTDEEYKRVSGNLDRAFRYARLKEMVKRLGWTRPALYRVKRLLHGLRERSERPG